MAADLDATGKLEAAKAINLAVAENISGAQKDITATIAIVVALLPTISAEGTLIATVASSISIVADLQDGALEVVELRGGDDRKPRLLFPDEQLDRQLKREDDEILAIIIAAMEIMNP